MVMVQLLAGLLLMAVPLPANLAFLARQHRRRRRWVRAEGIVVSSKYRKSPAAEDSGNYRTKYRFVDRSGQHRSGAETTLRRRKKGSSIPVMYDPDDPDRNELSSIGWLYLLLVGTAGACAVGAVLFVGAFHDLA